MANENTLEAALSFLERDIEQTQKAAAGVTRAIKALQKSVKEGNLRDLGSRITAAAQALQALDQQFANTKDGWSFDVDAHLASGAFTRELIGAARHTGLRIFEQDDRLYCYPSLIRILPAERRAQIDKTKESRLRPSVLAAELKRIQERPPRFKAEAFLECLYEAYQKLNTPAKGVLVQAPRVIKLTDIYRLLTLLPGQPKEYTRAEFARDIYLLDRSGVTTTRSGAIVSFPASTGTKTPSATINVITERGQEKRYYGISFQGPD